MQVSLRGLYLRLDLKNKMQWAFQARGGCPIKVLSDSLQFRELQHARASLSFTIFQSLFQA